MNNIINFIKPYIEAYQQFNWVFQLIITIIVILSKPLIIYIYKYLKRLRINILDNALRFAPAPNAKLKKSEGFWVMAFCTKITYYIWCLYPIIIPFLIVALAFFQIQSPLIKFWNTFLIVLLCTIIVVYTAYFILVLRARAFLSNRLKGDRTGLVGIITTNIKKVENSVFNDDISAPFERESYCFSDPVHFAHYRKSVKDKDGISRPVSISYEERLPYNDKEIEDEYLHVIKPHFENLKKEIDKRIQNKELKNEDLFYVNYSNERIHICDFLLNNVYTLNNICQKVEKVKERMRNEQRINFIGNKVGVYGFDLQKGNLTLKTYMTDHFTWLVFKELFKDQDTKGENDKSKEIKEVFQAFIRRVNKANTVEQNYIILCLKFLFSSFGFDLVISGRNAHGEKTMLVGVRNGSIEYHKNDKLHVPVNESFSTTDLDKDNSYLDPKACVQRGIIEELGLPEGIVNQAKIIFNDFAIVTDEGEIGLSCSVDFSDIISIEEIRCYAGQDKYMELKGLIEVPYPPFFWNQNKYPSYFYRAANNNDLLCTPWESFTPILYQRCVVRGAKQSIITEKFCIFILSLIISMAAMWIIFGSKDTTPNFADHTILTILTFIWNVIVFLCGYAWRYYRDDHSNYIMPLLPQWGGDVDVLQCTALPIFKRGNPNDSENQLADGIKIGMVNNQQESKEDSPKKQEKKKKQEKQDTETASLGSIHLVKPPYCSVRREVTGRVEFPISFFLVNKNEVYNNDNKLFFYELPCYLHEDQVIIDLDIIFDENDKFHYSFSRSISPVHEPTLYFKHQFSNNEVEALSKYYSLPEEFLSKRVRYATLDANIKNTYAFLDLFHYHGNYYWSIRRKRFNNAKTASSPYKIKEIELNPKTDIFNDCIKGALSDNKNTTIRISGSRDLIEKKLPPLINHPSNRKRFNPLDIYMLQLSLIRMTGKDYTHGILLAIKHKTKLSQALSRIESNWMGFISHFKRED